MAKTIISFQKITLVKENAHKYDFNRDASSPKNVYDFLKTVLDITNEPNEKFVAVMLSTKNEIVGVQVLSSGTINASMANARLVYQAAILHNAAAVIIAHNHPSGDAEPSREDIRVTQRIAEAGEIMEIPLLDHVICGENSFVSLAERGYI